nr:MAG TPA: hypothetical protein [Caudoviricetes sp.]
MVIPGSFMFLVKEPGIFCYFYPFFGRICRK